MTDDGSSTEVSRRTRRPGDTPVGRDRAVEEAATEAEAAAKRRGGPDDRAATRRRIAADESLIVDFVANFVAGGGASFEPVKGRVLMSDKRLVLATSSNRTVVPLTSIFDVAVGQVPAEVEQFFDYTVMVGYVHGKTRRTMVIGGDRETIETFSVILYRATLNGSRTTVRHPARIGGRVMETTDRPARIHLGSDTVVFPSDDPDLGAGGDPFEIDLAGVIFFEVLERTVRGDKRLVLSVRHVDDGRTVSSEISLGSRRKMNVLGRYLRQRYHSIKVRARDVDVSEEALEVLVGLYSTDADIDLASLLDVDDAELDARLAELFDDGLITENSQPCSLTPQGRFIVNEEIEEVNA